MAADLTFREFTRLRKPLLKSQFPFLKDSQIQARLKKQWIIRKKGCITTRQLSEFDSQGVDAMTDADKIKQVETKHGILEAGKLSSDCSPPAEDLSPILPSSHNLGNSSSSSVKKLLTRKQEKKKVKDSKVAGCESTKTKLGANNQLDSSVGNMVSGYLHHSCDSSESSPPPLSIDINACQTVEPYPLPAFSLSGISQSKADLSPSPQDCVCSDDSEITHRPDHSVAFHSSPTSSCHTADDELALMPEIIQRKSKTCIKRPPLLKEDKQQTLCGNPPQEDLAQLTNVQHEEEAVEKNEGVGKERRVGRNMACNQLQEEGNDDALFTSKYRKKQQHIPKVDPTGGAMCALFLPLHSASPQDDCTNQSVPDTDNNDSLPFNDEDSIFL